MLVHGTYMYLYLYMYMYMYTCSESIKRFLCRNTVPVRRTCVGMLRFLVSLLSIVREYVKSFGPLPLLQGKSGKPFCFVIEGIPGVEVGGDTPSNTFITLKRTESVQPSIAAAEPACKVHVILHAGLLFLLISVLCPPKSQPSIVSLPALGMLINTRQGQPQNMEELRGLVAEICQLSNVIVRGTLTS